MNLLDIAQKDGRTYKRVSNLHGGEYHGPCPRCGGNDRFHIWPEQGDTGSWWCRQCDKGGDAIQYLIDMEGLSFPAACKELGRELPDQEEFNRPRFKRPGADTFTPRDITAPADLWIEHAGKFAEECHQRLLALGDGEGSPLAYLAERGITRETAIKHRLGWNCDDKGGDVYKAREAWGLDTVMNGDKKKKLWLPVGLVIPNFVNNIIRRIRIRIPNDRRTPEFSLSYYLVPGSSMDTFIINPGAQAFVIIEAELDAILVNQFCGDLTGSMAMGNSTAKPTAEAFALLADCLWIGNALDYDARTNEAGAYENPGGVGWLWWKKHFPHAERWPVPVGKDPGDAHKAGADLREWVKLGLPPILTLPKSAPRPVIAPPSQDNSGAVSAASSLESEAPKPVVHTLTAEDGRTIHITDDPAAYAALVAEGTIVFDSQEIALVKQSGADKGQAAAFLTAKQTFPGIRITEVTADLPAAPGPAQQYRGKFQAAR